MAQEVERILGKDEVTSSTLVSSSTMNDIPNLNCYGSIEMSFILFKSSRERLSRPFLIFLFNRTQMKEVFKSCAISEKIKLFEPRKFD